MSEKDIVYCVDDDERMLVMLKEILTDYDVVLLHSGQSCLEKAATNPPDVVLLDIKMPGMDGFETCRQLRELPNLHHVPVIFLSGDDSLESRLEGYTAGGDDYLSKPFAAEELIAKVGASVKRKEMLDQAHQQAKMAELSVSDIMKAMGEMSAVVNFFQATFSCRSYDSLAKRVIQAHETLGLDIAVEFNVDSLKLHYSTGDIETPLEASVFEYIRTKGRLVNCGKRAAVNYPHCTVIIRNMPIDDPDLYGRVRDHIALIAQGADSKIKALRTDLLIKEQREELVRIVTQIEGAINSIDADYKEQKEMNEIIFSAVESEFEDSYMTLGLTEQQEEFQRSIILAARDKTENLYDSGLDLEERFNKVLDEVQEALKISAIQAEEDDESEEDSGDAVELF